MDVVVSVRQPLQLGVSPLQLGDLLLQQQPHRLGLRPRRFLLTFDHQPHLVAPLLQGGDQLGKDLVTVLHRSLGTAL